MNGCLVPTITNEQAIYALGAIGIGLFIVAAVLGVGWLFDRWEGR